MDAKRDYVLDLIIKNLDDVNASLDKLSTYANGEIAGIKVELANLIHEIKMLKDRPCPRNTTALIEIIENDRLKYRSKQPKKFMEIVGWVVAVAVGFITIYFAIEKIIKP